MSIQRVHLLFLLIICSCCYQPLLLCQNPAITLTGDLCDGARGENVFTSGTFGSGTDNILPYDPKLAPGYRYVRVPPPDDGDYTITNNTTTWGSFAATSWINIKDNSPDPNGYFMVVNASYEPGLFYLDTVDVCENINYEFSADVITLNRPSLDQTNPFIRPNISFLINGQVVYNTGEVPVDETWHTYGFTFNTNPGVTKIVLALRNNAPGGYGNDLGLDNISFRPCGPNLNILDTVRLCELVPFQLDATVQGNAFADPVFQWQQSTDNGTTWMDIPGANQLTLPINDPMFGEEYRLLVANGISNLAKTSCRIVSNPSLLKNNNVFVNIDTTICPGKQINAADTILANPGDYEFVFPLDNGCDSTISVKLRQAPIYNLNAHAIICENTSYQFGSQILTTSGTYQQTFASTLGCDSTVTLSLQIAPNYNAIEKIDLCAGDTLRGKAYFADTTLTTSLKTGDGCDSIIQSTLRVFPTYNQITPMMLCDGTVFQGVTLHRDTSIALIAQSINGCDSIQTYQIDVELDDFTITGDTDICQGESTTLSGGNFPNIQWSTGATSANIDADKPGIYSATTRNANGCTYEDSIRVNVHQVSATITGTDPICNNDKNGTITISNPRDGVAPYTFSVGQNVSQSDPVFSGLGAGKYKVSVEDAIGCIYSESISLQNPLAFTVGIGTDTTITLGDTLQLNAIANEPIVGYQWQPSENLSCTDCSSPVAVLTQTGTIELLATDAIGCITQDAIFIKVGKERKIYAPNAFSPNHDGVNDYFTIYTGKGVQQIKKLEIFDRWGELVFSATNLLPASPASQWDGNFNGRPAVDGVYVWVAEIDFIDGKTKMYSGDVLLMR